MHHGPASEVQRTQTTIGADPATFAPHPMGQRVIDERGPEERKHQEAAELHSFGVGTTDECDGDHRKHGLEDHVGLMRNRRRIVGIRLIHRDASQPHPFQPADNVPLVRPESETVAPQHPLDADQAEDDEAVHNGPQRILLPDHPAVEQGQARGRHR